MGTGGAISCQSVDMVSYYILCKKALQLLADMIEITRYVNPSVLIQLLSAYPHISTDFHDNFGRLKQNS